MSLKSSLCNVVIQRQKSRKAHLRRELSPTMLNAEVFFDILSLSCKTVSYHHSFHVRLMRRCRTATVRGHRVLRNVLTNYILTIEVNPISRRKIIIKNHILLLSFSSTVTPFYWYELHFNIKRVSFLYKLEIQTY